MVTVATFGQGTGNFGNASGFGSRGHGGLGIGLDIGTNNALTQTNVKGTIAVSSDGRWPAHPGRRK